MCFAHPGHHYANRDLGPPPAAPMASFQSPATATGSFHRSVGLRCVGSEEQVNRCWYHGFEYYIEGRVGMAGLWIYFVELAFKEW